MTTSLWNRRSRPSFQRDWEQFFGTDPFFADLWRAQRSRRGAGVFPPVNLYDDGEGFLVRAEMPGVDKESLDVSCKDDQLTIRGTRALEVFDDEANLHRREREGGTFRRAISFPTPVNADKAHAEYRDGILEVFVPRAEEAQPRRIEVK